MRGVHATVRSKQQSALIQVGRDFVAHVGLAQHVDRHVEIAP
jgi:hypothetical protein